MLSDEEIFNLIAEKLPKKNILTILDVGCGDASFSVLFAKKLNAKVYGIDALQFMVNIGIENVYKHGLSELVSCLHQNAESLKFDNNYFDVVVAVRVFHELIQPSRAVEEIYRVLKSDGLLVIVDWDKNANTGVPEHYYSIEEIADYLKEKFSIFEVYQKNDLNFIFAKPKHKSDQLN